MSEFSGEDDYDLDEPEAPLQYAFQIRDVIGIGIGWLGDVLLTTGWATHAIAREIYASANKQRIESAEYESMSRADSELLALLESRDEES